MQRDPQQARSRDSTARMLRAARELLNESGVSGLTVDGVVLRAGTSTGAFYARFGSREGLMHALQDEFLSNMAERLTRSTRKAQESPDLYGAVHSFTADFLADFASNRSVFNAIMVQHISDEKMRTRGQQASRAAAAAFRGIISGYLPPDYEDTVHVCDVAFQTLFSLATQSVMFAPGEVTGVEWTETRFAAEVSRLLCVYLNDPAHGSQ